MCSLLQSSLQILGQTQGLLEILSKVVSWFRQWPGQVAPWPRWPGEADTSIQFYNPLLFAFERSPKLWPICCRNPKPSRSTNHQFFNPPLFTFGRIPKLSPNCCRNPRTVGAPKIWKLQMPNSGIYSLGSRTPKPAEQLDPPKTGNSRGLQTVVLFLRGYIRKVVSHCNWEGAAPNVLPDLGGSL